MSTLPRRAGIGVGVLLSLLVLASAGIHAATASRLTRRYVVPAHAPARRTDPAAIARGQRLAAATGRCADCHGEDLGGRVMPGSPVLGRFVAPNLTAGQGGLWDYTDADWERAVRHGVARDGRALVAMPALELRRLSDEDMAALTAYLRQLAPVDRLNPPTEVRLLARTLWLTGSLPLVDAERIDHGEAH
jgi:mono/diheme cytochrome c family protein